ncbi:hypothetical protein [Labrenzia sp. PHM005]|uniref:hypothetical protein n=1 Tax=Labrenzia sp. PHM005 TaxID=2590016 RepID=UPI00143D76B2|nr:hypothetical protein [Labrenzia sp. PHM005]
MKRAHRTAHARIWTVLGIALPLAFFTILALRQSPPADRPAVLLEKPSNGETSGEASQ